jgi:hypothetical protein
VLEGRVNCLDHRTALLAPPMRPAECAVHWRTVIDRKRMRIEIIEIQSHLGWTGLLIAVPGGAGHQRDPRGSPAHIHLLECDHQ